MSSGVARDRFVEEYVWVEVEFAVQQLVDGDHVPPPASIVEGRDVQLLKSPLVRQVTQLRDQLRRSPLNSFHPLLIRPVERPPHRGRSRGGLTGGGKWSSLGRNSR